MNEPITSILKWQLKAYRWVKPPQETVLKKKNSQTLQNKDKTTEYQNGEVKSDLDLFHQISFDITIVVGGN